MNRPGRTTGATVRNCASGGARILAGGRQLTDGGLGKGFYCAPTLAEAPLAHALWQHEMFVPIAMLARVADRETAMALANKSTLGLTAGFYGATSGSRLVLRQHRSGRELTRTGRKAPRPVRGPAISRLADGKVPATPAKGIASAYYLALYQREQSQTHVE